MERNEQPSDLPTPERTYPVLDEAAKRRIAETRKRLMNTPWARAREEALRESETLRGEDFRLRMNI